MDTKDKKANLKMVGMQRNNIFGNVYFEMNGNKVQMSNSLEPMILCHDDDHKKNEYRIEKFIAPMKVNSLIECNIRGNVNYYVKNNNLNKLQEKILNVSSLAIFGLPSMGKTELVLYYAKLYFEENFKKNKNYFVFFLSFQDIFNEYIKLGKLLGVPIRGAYEDILTQINRLKHEINQRLDGFDTWLLIFDDVKELDEIKNFIPDSKKGKVIITTNNANFYLDPDCMLSIDPINKGESKKLLENIFCNQVPMLGWEEMVDNLLCTPHVLAIHAYRLKRYNYRNNNKLNCLQYLENLRNYHLNNEYIVKNIEYKISPEEKIKNLYRSLAEQYSIEVQQLILIASFLNSNISRDFFSRILNKDFFEYNEELIEIEPFLALLSDNETYYMSNLTQEIILKNSKESLIISSISKLIDFFGKNLIDKQKSNIANTNASIFTDKQKIDLNNNEKSIKNSVKITDICEHLTGFLEKIFAQKHLVSSVIGENRSKIITLICISSEFLNKKGNPEKSIIILNLLNQLGELEISEKIYLHKSTLLSLAYSGEVNKSWEEYLKLENITHESKITHEIESTCYNSLVLLFIIKGKARIIEDNIHLTNENIKNLVRAFSAWEESKFDKAKYHFRKIDFSLISDFFENLFFLRIKVFIELFIIEPSFKEAINTCNHILHQIRDFNHTEHHSTIYNLLGKIYFKLNNYEEALKYFSLSFSTSKILKIMPNILDSGVSILITKSFLEKNHYPETNQDNLYYMVEAMNSGIAIIKEYLSSKDQEKNVDEIIEIIESLRETKDFSIEIINKLLNGRYFYYSKVFGDDYPFTKNAKTDCDLYVQLTSKNKNDVIFKFK